MGHCAPMGFGGSVLKRDRGCLVVRQVERAKTQPRVESGSWFHACIRERATCPFHKFIPLESVRFLDAAMLDEFFDHWGIGFV
jgi:hypothetical protein